MLFLLLVALAATQAAYWFGLRTDKRHNFVLYPQDKANAARAMLAASAALASVILAIMLGAALGAALGWQPSTIRFVAMLCGLLVSPSMLDCLTE